MALMGKPDEKGAVQNAATALDEAAAKKKAAVERFKANRAAKQKAAFENGVKLRDELTKAGLMDKLSPALKEFVNGLAVDPAVRKASGFGGPSVFQTLFGDKPVVGQKITLEEAMMKTFKGKSTLDLWVKRWAEKDIIVECTIDTAKMLNTTYTIKSLPAK